jgi:uncharacterized iron-regulated protein
VSVSSVARIVSARLRRADALLLLVFLAACAARQPTAPRDHPLVGRFWDVRAGAWVDESKVAKAVASADFVFLGETHDNPEHHRLQARMLEAMVSAGRRPAATFEMLEVDQQPKIDAALAKDPRDPDALAAAVGWNRSGWPAFALYRPIFAVALDAGLPIVAANLSRPRARAVASQGLSALEPRVRDLLERAKPLSPEALDELREEMAASHCGQMPESMLEPLVRMQRARDAEIAARVLDAGRERGAVLIAGSGHVRTDRGVPSYVALDTPNRSRVAVAFLEALEGEDSLDAYAERFSRERFPFDYVGFTVRQEREDPCRGIEKRIHPIAPEPKDGTWVWRLDASTRR